MRTVLVTGGAGYIGSHACKALARAGYVPVTYDNLSAGHRWAVRWGPLEVGDIQDPERLDAVLARHRPEAVMHFAAFLEVAESVRNPTKYFRNNTAGALTLIEAMLRRDVKRIVFSSTCAVHGVPDTVPIAEDTPRNPINPYGASKLMVERMLADCGAAHGLQWTALRYFNASGCDPDGETGEAHDPEPHLIPRALMAAEGTLKDFQVFGTDYATPDGTCVRDYIHVSDLADAHVAALGYLADGGASTPINLGVGRGFSVREIIDAVERVTGRKVPATYGPRRQGDPDMLVADPALARRVLAFRPRFTEIDRIVETAWAWHSRHAARARAQV